jgi:hypothetical protein
MNKTRWLSGDQKGWAQQPPLVNGRSSGSGLGVGAETVGSGCAEGWFVVAISGAGKAGAVVGSATGMLMAGSSVACKAGTSGTAGAIAPHPGKASIIIKKKEAVIVAFNLWVPIDWPWVGVIV